MILTTIGFTKKTAEQFFGLIRDNHVELLADIRLNNRSQLAGFTKGDDLEFFLRELCSCAYRYCPEYAPTKEILSAYQKKELDWVGYTLQYNALMEERGKYREFTKKFARYSSVCLLCSEPTPEKCHRRLLAELIALSSDGVEVRHLL